MNTDHDCKLNQAFIVWDNSVMQRAEVCTFISVIVLISMSNFSLVILSRKSILVRDFSIVFFCFVVVCVYSLTPVNAFSAAASVVLFCKLNDIQHNLQKLYD